MAANQVLVQVYVLMVPDSGLPNKMPLHLGLISYTADMCLQSKCRSSSGVTLLASFIHYVSVPFLYKI